MLTILLVGLFVYLLYTFSSVIVWNKGKSGLQFPPSISETFYIMPRWAFVGFLMICMGCIMTISYMYMDAVGSLALFSLTNVGALILAGVPAFANMHYKKVRPLHLICAGLGFAVLAAGFGVDYSMWYWTITMVGVAITTLIISRKSNPMWWVEHALVLTMLLGYGILSITC